VTDPTPDLPALTRPQILLVMGVTAVLLLAIAKLWLYFGDVSLLPTELALVDVALGAGAAAAIVAASNSVYQLWPAYRHSARQYLELLVRPLHWPDLFWLGLLPGMSEELLFRGIMIPALGSGAIAIVVSSAIFGLLHAGGPQPLPYVVWATVVGAALGTLAIATGNLLVPVIAHVGANWVSSCLWKLDPDSQ